MARAPAGRGGDDAPPFRATLVTAEPTLAYTNLPVPTLRDVIMIDMWGQALRRSRPRQWV